MSIFVTSSALSILSGGAFGSFFGSAGGAAPAAAGSSLAALKLAEANKTRDIDAVRKSPAVAREIAAFEKAVADAQTPEQLLANASVRNVIMTAAGLGDFKDYRGMVTKILTSDINDPASQVNRIAEANPAWASVTRTFDFANKDLAIIKIETFRKVTIDQFVEAKWRESLETRAPGLSFAVEFKARASNLDSAIKILGDGVAREVVTTTLGLPPQIALQPLKSQEQAIERRLDIARLQEPTFLDQFVRRYLTAVEGRNAGILA